MKANNGKGNNNLRDEWQTPQDLFDELNKQYKFNVDCCATKENSKCNTYITNFECVNSPFHETFTLWMNPPFSIAWKMFDNFFKVVKKGVAIYRCDNLETAIWQKIIFPNADWILIPNKRISYEGLDGEGARFPSALIGIGVDIAKINGTALKKVEVSK